MNQRGRPSSEKRFVSQAQDDRPPRYYRQIFTRRVAGGRPLLSLSLSPSAFLRLTYSRSDGRRIFIIRIPPHGAGRTNERTGRTEQIESNKTTTRHSVRPSVRRTNDGPSHRTTTMSSRDRNKGAAADFRLERAKRGVLVEHEPLPLLSQWHCTTLHNTDCCFSYSSSSPDSRLLHFRRRRSPLAFWHATCHGQMTMMMHIKSENHPQKTKGASNSLTLLAATPVYCSITAN